MNITTNIRLIIVSSITACTALWAMPGTVRGQQIYETNNNGTVGEYNATTGAAINAPLLSYNSSGAVGLAVFGGNLWVGNYFANTVGEYNATTGATINSSLVSGLTGSYGIAAVRELSVCANSLGAIGVGSAASRGT